MTVRCASAAKKGGTIEYGPADKTLLRWDTRNGEQKGGRTCGRSEVVISFEIRSCGKWLFLAPETEHCGCGTLTMAIR